MKHEKIMEEFDHNDPLWELLGRQKKAEASPWFVNRVMSHVTAPTPAPSWFQLCISRWVPVCALVVVFLGAWSSVESSATHSKIPLQTSIDFEVIRNLDLYLATVDSKVWTQ